MPAPEASRPPGAGAGPRNFGGYLRVPLKGYNKSTIRVPLKGYFKSTIRVPLKGHYKSTIRVPLKGSIRF